MNMRSNPCPVCQGRRKITMRLHQPMSVRVPADDHLVAMAVPIAAKDYPCPECSPTTGEEKVAILTHGASVSMHPIEAKDADYVRAIKRTLAHDLVEGLVSRGAIAFRTCPPEREDGYYQNVRIEATIGVVSPNVVASMQERITANSGAVATQMAEAAAAAVRIWGSHYTGDEGGISKGQAVDAIYRGLKNVLEALRKASA